MSPCVQEKLPMASSLCEKMYKSSQIWQYDDKDKQEFVCGGDGCEEKSDNSVGHYQYCCYKYNDYVFNI